jgi:capsular exopolysaccharide synthesis family protein
MEMDKNLGGKSVEPEEIDIKELFKTVGRYKWSILFIVLIFLGGAAVYAFFSPNVYKATTTMKISTEMAKSVVGGNFMRAALGGGSINLDDEFALIKSRFLAKKVLEELDIGTRYFTIEHFKKKELYKDSPFVISVESIKPVFYGREMQLVPVDSNHFRLYVKPTLKEKIYYKICKFLNLPVQPLIEYDRIHEYAKKIATPWFIINIQKVYELKNQIYLFSIVPNKNMYGFVQGGIDAAPMSKFGSIVKVSFQDTVPMRAKDIVEVVVKAYRKEKIRLKTESANRTLNFIDSQLKAIHQTLKKSASKLQSFKATHVVMDIGAKAGTTVTKLGELESKVYEINTQISILDNLLNYIMSNKDIKGIDVSSAQLVGPVISGLIVKLQEAVSLRSTLLVDFTELHPDVIKVTEQIDRLKSMLTESIKSTLNGLKIRKASLMKLINESRAALRALPKEEQQLAQLTRDFMVNEKIYSFLLQKRAETAIVEASKVSEIQILDSAFVPGGPIKPKRGRIVLIGLLVGLVLGLLQAFVRKHLDNTIKSVEDVEKLTFLPVYGVVPDIKSKKMKSAYFESLRVIRTNLEFLGIGSKSKLVTITSSFPQEGKTTTTVELSKIIAKIGKRVIVLDLDMRRSKLHELLKIPNKGGMSTLLAGKVGLKDAIQRSREENLDVITSGPMPPNPSELLMSDTFKRVIAALRNEYDYVMLDSPPIGLVTDAMIVMRMSDINLIVLRANYSQKDFLKNINRFVEEKELKAGIILNGVKTEPRSGAYGFGYGYNHGNSNNYYS